MNAEAELRPSSQQLTRALDQLAGNRRPWAKRRKELLRAFAGLPDGEEAEIARRAGTEVRVVKRLLSRLRSAGEASLSDFGRPIRLGPSLKAAVKQRIVERPRTSVAELRDWLEQEKNVSVSFPTLRAACNQFGFKPPCRRRTAPRQHFQWSPEQLTKLRSLLPAIGARAEALLIAGTQKTHLKDLAARFALSVYRLRKDLNAFLRGRLEQVTARTRHPDAQDMLRKGFFKWCDSQYAQHNNQCPTGRAAQEYLRTMHLEVKMPTVYWYLKLWRQERQRHNQVVPGRNYERSINFETGAEKRHLGSLEKWHARRNERPAKR